MKLSRDTTKVSQIYFQTDNNLQLFQDMVKESTNQSPDLLQDHKSYKDLTLIHIANHRHAIQSQQRLQASGII